MDHKNWLGFAGEDWKEHINVRSFIQNNYTPYTGDESFLSGPTERTRKLFSKFEALLRQEQEKGGVLDVDTEHVSSLTSYQPAYLDKELELIVGYQTEKPLTRGVNPFGGIRMARSACEAYGYKLSEKVEQEFTYRTTHNDGVYRVYSDEMRKARKCGVITGLPDAYGRGRIIGDYRRVALYGIDRLIDEKKKDKADIAFGVMDADVIRQSEELFQQIAFLQKLKEMASMYGYDISEPETTFKTA